MKNIKIIAKNTIKKGEFTGCRECVTSCQSACKTSCTIANQSCQNPRVNKELGEENR